MKWYIKTGIVVFAVIAIVSLFAWSYFSAGEEVYPEGLVVGACAPSFAGYDQYGNKVNLDSIRQNQKVVVVFFRGTWCPVCNAYIGELEHSLKQIVDKGAAVVTVTPEKPEFLGEDDFKTSIDIPVVHDADQSIMQAYQVDYELSLGTQRVFGTAGIDLEDLTGTDTSLPAPAVYVIGMDGKIEYADVGAGGLKIAYASVEELLRLL